MIDVHHCRYSARQEILSEMPVPSESRMRENLTYGLMRGSWLSDQGSLYQFFTLPKDIPVDTENIPLGNVSVPVGTPLHFMQLNLQNLRFLQVLANTVVRQGVCVMKCASSGAFPLRMPVTPC